MVFQEEAHHNKQDLHIPIQSPRKGKISSLEEEEHVSFTVDIKTIWEKWEAIQEKRCCSRSSKNSRNLSSTDHNI